MGFSFGKFLKKALNPLSPFQQIKGMNQRLKEGGVKSLLDPTAGFRAMGGALAEQGSTGQPQQSFAKAGGPQEAFAQAPEMAAMKGGSMGPGVGSFRRMGGGMGQPSFGGGFGGFGRFGGMDEGLQKIIQDYYRNKRGGGGGGGMMGGGGFSQFGG